MNYILRIVIYNRNKLREHLNKKIVEWVVLLS